MAGDGERRRRGRRILEPVPDLHCAECDVEPAKDAVENCVED